MSLLFNTEHKTLRNVIVPVRINAAPDPRNANVTNVILLKQKWPPGHIAIEKIALLISNSNVKYLHFSIAVL